MQLLFCVDEAKNYLIDGTDNNSGLVGICSVSKDFNYLLLLCFILFFRWKHLIVWQHYL